MTGLLDIDITQPIPQDVVITLLHASTNPLIGGFGVGVIPGTDHLAVYKIIPLNILTEEYMKSALSELIEQIGYWNNFWRK